MARPVPRPKPPRPFRYASVAECEDPDNETKGYHLAEVKQWPPQRTHAGEAIPSVSTKCVHCNVNVTLDANNDPENTNWQIRVLEREKPEPVPAAVKK